MQYKHFRPRLGALAPGVASYVEGKYYFDGVQMHVELGIQMSSTGAGFMGTLPTFTTPTAMEYTSPFFPLVLGVGHAHDATLGSLHPVAAVRASQTTAAFYYLSGSNYLPITATAPISWGIVDGLYVKVSYIPTVQVAPKNFTAFGDSISRFENSAGNVNDIGWTPFVPVANQIVFGGGFARDSATTAIIVAGARRMNADVAVCLAGVNDIALGVPQATTLANVVALRNKVQASRFILCQIASYNANPAAAASLNAAYATVAAANGMILLDPYAAWRQPNGLWTAGASFDGVHPTAAVQQAAGLVFRAAVVAAAAI